MYMCLCVCLCVCVFVCVCAHIKLSKSLPSRGRTKLFFSVVTRKYVVNFRGIFRISQDNESCIMDKNGTQK